MILENHWRLFHDDLCETLSGFPFEPSHAKVALKTALSCVIAVMLTYFLRIPHAYWAGISVLIMMQPHVAAELMKGWQRAGGACIGSFLGIFYAGLVAQSPLLFTLMSFSIVTLGFYLGNTRKYGYFWFYMSFHLHVICILSIMGPTGEAKIDPGSIYPEHIAFYRASAVSIGVVVSVIVNLLFKPDFAFGIARKTVLDVKKCLKEFLEITTRNYLQAKFDDDDFEKKYSELTHLLNSYAELFEHSMLEKKFFFEEELPMSKIRAEDIRKCAKDIRSHYKGFAKAGKLEYHRVYRELLETIPGLFYKAMLRRRGSEQKLKDALDKLMIPQARDSSGKFLYNMEDIVLFRGFTGCLQKLYRAVFREENSLEQEDIPRNMEPGFRSWFGRININVPIMKTALRGGFAIVLVFWLWLWLEIPGGGAAMAISVIAVFQVNLLNSEHKGLLRFAGCFFGAAAGLFVLALGIESTLIISIVLFFVIYFFAYIWSGKPGSAYMGLQGALAFLVCVMCSDAPADSTSSGIERLSGIFVGISCLWLVNNVFFPMDMRAQFKEVLETVKRDLLRKLERAENMLLSGRNDFLPKPIDMESHLQLISQLEDFKEISVSDAFVSRKMLFLFDDLSMSLAKASELLREKDKFHIDLYGHYGDIFERLRNALTKIPENAQSEESSSNAFDEELWGKEAEAFFELARVQYKEGSQKVYICEVFLNKMDLAKQILNLKTLDDAEIWQYAS